MASRSSHVRVKRKPTTMISELISAVSEWCLIIVLLLNAVLAYIATKLAQLMNLRVPCLLCSRLDHILGNDQHKGLYRNLLCNGHKVEIAELAYCEQRRKLGNAKEMCEACLLSSVSQKKLSYPDACRVLIGKLGKHLAEGHEMNGDSADEPKDHSEETKVCTCCSQTMEKMPFSSFQSKPKECQTEVPSKATQGEGKKKKDNHVGSKMETDCEVLGKKKKKKEKSSGSKSKYVDCESPTKKDKASGSKMDSNQKSHLGYRKLTSDTESEIHNSDEDNSTTAGQGDAGEWKEVYSRRAPKIPVPNSTKKGKVLPAVSNASEGKMIHPTSVVQESPTGDQKSKLVTPDDSKKNSTKESTNAIGHGLEQINWSQIDVPNKAAASSEKIDVPNTTATSSGSKPQQVRPEVSNEQSETIVVGEILCAPVIGSNPETAAKVSPTTSQVTNEQPSQPVRRILESNDSIKAPFTTKGSPRFSEILASKESSRVHEDLKMRLTQRSPLRVFETSWSDIGSPKQLIEVKSSDASSSPGLQSVTRRLADERSSSGLESTDGSLFAETDATWSVERLRQQLETDRKIMTNVYKDLEEERNASEIAINEAMAMINRLQEEKAAMQMEALQYLRMMEEQSEYDQETIQKLNDQINEREKDLLELETELERYRRRYGEETIEEKVIEPLKAYEIVRTNSMNSNTIKKSMSRSKSDKFDVAYLKSSDSFKMQDPFLDFEEEKAYIEEYLKSLLQRLNASAGTNGVYDVKQNEQVDLKEISESGVNYNGHCKKGDTISLQDEVSRLRDKLEAFEADGKFLELTLNTLRSGDDGLQFVQDIACQLREVRIIQAAQAE